MGLFSVKPVFLELLEETKISKLNDSNTAKQMKCQTKMRCTGCPHYGKHNYIPAGCDIVCQEPWGNASKCKRVLSKKMIFLNQDVADN
jgi:hypothetical protein